MKDKSNAAIEWLMRSGYAARGVVYFIVGGLAIYAAIGGGRAQGSSGALEYLARQPFGTVLLAIVAAGLFAYSLWRFVDAAMDLENEGDDAEGVGSRIGQFISGATHVALGVTAITIIAGGSSGGSSGGGAEDWTAQLMQNGFGRIVVVAAGAVTFGVGIYLFAKAYRAKWKKKLRNTQTTEKLSVAVAFGLYAHGFVLLIIGGLIAWAGVAADPQKAAGLGEALRILENQPFGRTLLGLAGAGMIGFALYCAIQARYRIVPKLSDDDIPTLASATA